MLVLSRVKLGTSTVTESGYAPGSPLFEYLACGLRNRNSPITILCCDNIRQNGRALEAQFLAYLYQTNQNELADWVRENVSFQSSKVDRITPRTPASIPFEVTELFPGSVTTALTTQDFHQLVIEYDFTA